MAPSEMIPVMCEGRSFSAGRKNPVTLVRIIVIRNAIVHQAGRPPFDIARITQAPVPIGPVANMISPLCFQPVIRSAVVPACVPIPWYQSSASGRRTPHWRRTVSISSATKCRALSRS